MVFLQQYGISTNLAVKIYKEYGDEAQSIVRLDPYRLIRDIWGIGFRTADKIAQALGLPVDAPSRLAAGITHVLTQASEDGHVDMPGTILLQQSAELLQIPAEPLKNACDTLVASHFIEREALGAAPDLAVYLEAFHQAEKETAWRLHTLLLDRHSFLADLAQLELLPATVNDASKLSDEQMAALRTGIGAQSQHYHRRSWHWQDNRSEGFNRYAGTQPASLCSGLAYG